MSYAPIVLFVYNRPWHTRQTVEALQKNHLAKQSDLIVFSDAAKTAEVKQGVNEVRDYLKTITGFNSIKIIERQENFGLAKSIITGVTDIVKQYGKVIVLEDDIVTSPYFLNFMNDSLDMYHQENNVFGVTGYAYPIDTSGLSDVFFLRDEGCWGWATWDRAWKFFEKDTDKLMKTFDNSMIRSFNFDNTNDIWSQVILNYEGKINTWAVYWYATVFLNNGYFLHPKHSFVNNIGHDDSGVHCAKNNDYEVSLIQEYEGYSFMPIEINQQAYEAHKKYFRKINPLKSRVKNKIKKIIKKVFKI